jgi:hypothetical protein
MEDIRFLSLKEDLDWDYIKGWARDLKLNTFNLLNK